MCVAAENVAIFCATDHFWTLRRCSRASGIALMIVILLNFHSTTRVQGASCCQNKLSTGRPTGSRAKSQQQQQEPVKRPAALLEELNELDREYKLYLTNSILHNFRVQNVPQQAADWRKKSKLASQTAPENVDDLFLEEEDENDENYDVIRRYTLEVIGRRPDGKKEAHRIRQKRHKHRHHDGQNHEQQQQQNKECVITYEFNVTLINELSAKFETLMDKAEFLLPGHRRSAERGRFLLYGTDLLLNTEEEVVEGEEGDQRDRRRQASESAISDNDERFLAVFDVTDSLIPLWSTQNGVNLTGAWISRAACRKPTRQGHRVIANDNDDAVAVDRDATAVTVGISVVVADDDADAFAPTLRLQLKEKLRRQRKRQHAIKRQTAESMLSSRMTSSSATSQSQNDAAGADKDKNRQKTAGSQNHSNRRHQHQNQQHSSHRRVVTGTGNNNVIDCEEQWDASFFRTFNDSEYDALMPCCRRKVKINFADLGWDQWVLSPRSFDAYYCIGRCSTFGVGGSGGLAALDDADAGAAFYAEMMNLQRRGGNRLSPCCSPTKFAPLTIKVLSGVNEEATQTLDNLIVRQCGCM